MGGTYLEEGIFSETTMNFSRLKILILFPVIMMAGCASIHERGDYQAGETLAAHHISQGRYSKMGITGVGGPGTNEMRAALKKKYGIGYTFDPRASKAFAKGFNVAMDKALKAKYGNDYWWKNHKELFPEMHEGMMAYFTTN